MYKLNNKFSLVTIFINILISSVLQNYVSYNALGQEIHDPMFHGSQRIESPQNKELSNKKTQCSNLEYSLVYSQNKLVFCGSKAVPILVKALKDSDSKVRLHAAHNLGRIGPNASSATPDLVKILQDIDPNLYIKSNRNFNNLKKISFALMIIRTLEEIGPRANQAVPALEKYFMTIYNLQVPGRDYSQSSIARMEVENRKQTKKRVLDYIYDAVESIRKTEDLSPSQKPQLSQYIKQLEDDDPKVRSESASMLEDLGPAAKPAIPQLITALKDDDDRVNFNAVSALEKIGAPAVPALIEVLDDKNSDKWTKGRAGDILHSIGPQAKAAVPVLIKQLQDPNPNLRSNAAFVLKYIGPIEQSSIPFLIEALSDPISRVRSDAASALGAIDADGQSTFALLKALRDKEQSVRFSASRALANFGPMAVPGLLHALQDDDEKVRTYASFSLIGLGAGAKKAVPTLRKLVKSPNKNISRKASMVLKSLSRR